MTSKEQPSLAEPALALDQQTSESKTELEILIDQLCKYLPEKNQALIANDKFRSDLKIAIDLIDNLATKHTEPGIEKQELVQAGWVGLIKALGLYDHNKINFNWFAYHYIDNHIKEAKLIYTLALNPSPETKDIQQGVENLDNKQSSSDEPLTDEEIAEALGISLERLAKLRKGVLRKPYSLTRNGNVVTSTGLEPLIAPQNTEEEAIEHDLRAFLINLIEKCLAERPRNKKLSATELAGIVYLYYYCKLTHKKIGQKINKTHQAVNKNLKAFALELRSLLINWQQQANHQLGDEDHVVIVNNELLRLFNRQI